MRILGLIPARGGSKGVPLKNCKELNGKPLLYYTIDTGLTVEKLDSLIFSSEDETLISMAKARGVEVPFIRPSELAIDAAGSLGVVQHALKAMLDLGRTYDAVCLLQVTTPFRSATQIDEAITKFITEGSDSLISVQRVPHQYNPHWVFEATDKNTLRIATGENQIIKRRQELPDSYIRDGAIYITKTDVLMNQNSFFGNSISYIESDPNTFVNIDTMEDWEKAEQILKRLNL
jgi:CMP-N,N'-diacetyllegionaminic acid synthase